MFCFALVEDSYTSDWEDRRRSAPRCFLPRSISAPYTCLEGIAEGTEEEENDTDEAPWLGKQETNEDDRMVDDGDDVSGLVDEDVQHDRHAEAFIVDLLQRRFLKDVTSWQESHANYWQEWPTINDLDLDQNTSHEDNYQDAQDGTLYEAPLERYYNDAQHATLISPHGMCEDPATTLQMDSINSHHLHHYVPKTIVSDSAQHSVEVAHRLHLPRMIQKGSWAPRGQNFANTSSHSQSEESFLRRDLATHPHYHTVQRDSDYGPGQRLWSSSADLSWKDQETLPMMRSKHLPYHTLPQPYALDHRRNLVPATDPRIGSDSSLSETCSPRSSSLSSDSDVSGGLVWPQQLPPCVSSLTQNAPSAVVRIKASHALKRKILRFRSGSLKVMTTV